MLYILEQHLLLVSGVGEYGVWFNIAAVDFHKLNFVGS